ncbi:MAG: HNH endonuclease [Dysgonamonadaceae bacterium]|jgi:site-specific DNA-methyltransferase (adenine-specific)|nr:HNH endonuclease [Dysgonamonadaceae bacterium]
MNKNHKMNGSFTNTLYTNDNLFILNGLNSNWVDLIYLDPPFNSKRFYSAPIGSKAAGSSFKDMWTWQDVNEEYLNTLAENYPALTEFIAAAGVMHSKAMAAYLTCMAQRIVEMHRVLKDTGSLYLHCDPTASHYLKALLDELFGRKNFRNEIIWCYKRPSAPKQRQLPRLHDVIFWYSKGDTWTFNGDNIRVPYAQSSMDRAGYAANASKMTDGGIVELKDGGKLPEDWWDIPMLKGNSKESTGYPTQKPLALLHRIIKASSNEGDIVMDPFCGCATTCVAAQQLGRKWIGIDIEKQAVSILIERLSNDAGLFKDFVHTSLIPQRTDIRFEAPSAPVKERLYKEQNGLCNACGSAFDIRNLETDHIIPKAKGGGDYYENYQLLCSSCNKIKGDRPMEYLRLKIETRKKLLKEKITFGE